MFALPTGRGEASVFVARQLGCTEYQKGRSLRGKVGGAREERRQGEMPQRHPIYGVRSKWKSSLQSALSPWVYHVCINGRVFISQDESHFCSSFIHISVLQINAY